MSSFELLVGKHFILTSFYLFKNSYRKYSQSLALATTGEKLTALRNKMRENGYHAYIIPSEDEHQSEYTAEKDKQREWISGFTGSAGIAVVTLTKAALWSDSRYFIRGDKELDKNFWIFMKTGSLIKT